MSAPLQLNATANGNGSSLALFGQGTATLTVNCAGCSGGTTVNFEGSQDGQNWAALLATESGTTTTGTSTITAGVTVWQVNVAGYAYLRARISSYSAGTITVSASAVLSSRGLGGSGGGSVSPGNPTATAGPTPNNGAASTFMRSDASPPVQLATNAQFGIVEVGTGLGVTTGTVSLDVTHANSWSGIQTFGSGMLSLSGSSSGSALLEPPATASGTYTLPTMPGSTACLDVSTSGAFGTAATDCPIGTLTATVKTTNYTVLTTDQANYLGAGGASSITFKLPNPGAAPGASYPLYDSTLHGYSVTTIAGTALLAGNFSGGSATTQVIGTGGTVVCVDATTFYQCQYSPVSGTGSPTGSTGTPQYNAGGTFGAVSCNVVLAAPTGNSTTDTTNLQNAVNTAVQCGNTHTAGTIIVQCATANNYQITTVTWTGPGPTFKAACPAQANNESAPYVGSAFVHASSTGCMLCDNNTGLTQVGPQFFGISLVGNGPGTGTDTCLYIQATMHVIFADGAVKQCGGVGIDLDDGGVDDSEADIRNNEMYENGTAIECTGSATGCNNVFQNNNIVISTGQIGIAINPAANSNIPGQGVRISRNHFNCGATNNQIGVLDLGYGVDVADNFFELCSPAVYIPTTQTGNMGRGLMLHGNTLTGTFTAISVTCTSTNSSASLTSCGSTTGLVDGMIAYGGNAQTPYPYGSAAPGAFNNPLTMNGNNSVSSFVTNSSITLTHPVNSSGGGTQAFTFCAAQYSFPLALTSAAPEVSYGNHFTGNCGGANALQDGG